MAVVTGAAMRLEDWAKNSNNNVTKGLTIALYETTSVLKDVPFVQDSSLKATGVRIAPGGLPSPTYGSLNNTPDRVRTTLEQHQETAFLLRENVYMDTRYKNMKGLITNPVKIQTTGLMEAWARRLNSDFLYNDPTQAGYDPLAPVGLATRLRDYQKYGHVAECMIDGSGLLVNATATKANALAFFTEIDRLLMYLNAADGTGVVLYMNDDMLRTFSRLVKLSDLGAGFDVTKDNYDRSIQTYKGARLRDIGRRNDDVTRIITGAENQAGTAYTGGDRTSIYGVRYGDSYLTGWHDGAMDLKYIGQDDTGTQDIWLLDYQAGLYHAHTRTVARLFGIKGV